MKAEDINRNFDPELYDIPKIKGSIPEGCGAWVIRFHGGPCDNGVGHFEPDLDPEPFTILEDQPHVDTDFSKTPIIAYHWQLWP
jgi:hypothetical protein